VGSALGSAVVFGGTMALIAGVGTGVLTSLAVATVALMVGLAWSPGRRPLGTGAKVALVLLRIVVLVAMALLSA
jgi:hypothetical protein